LQLGNHDAILGRSQSGRTVSLPFHLRTRRTAVWFGVAYAPVNNLAAHRMMLAAAVNSTVVADENLTGRQRVLAAG